MKELKACVCGQKELLYHDKETNVVCCPTCGVSGPWRDSDGSKWNAMNDRGEEDIANLLKALEQDRRDRIDRLAVGALQILGNMSTEQAVNMSVNVAFTLAEKRH